MASDLGEAPRQALWPKPHRATQVASSTSDRGGKHAGSRCRWAARVLRPTVLLVSWLPHSAQAQRLNLPQGSPTQSALRSPDVETPGHRARTPAQRHEDGGRKGKDRGRGGSLDLASGATVSPAVALPQQRGGSAGASRAAWAPAERPALNCRGGAGARSGLPSSASAGPARAGPALLGGTERLIVAEGNPPLPPPGAGAPCLGPTAAGSGLDLAGATTPDPPGRAERRSLLEQQRAEQLKAEQQSKLWERKVALQRIEDDRKRIKERMQQAQAMAPQVSSPEPGRQPSSSGDCLLVIRLPAGDPVRGRFLADSSLESVRQQLLSWHPELPASSNFQQNFPRRRFGPADMPQTLQALGLTPSATLCVVDPVPEAPGKPEPGPSAQASPEEGVRPGLAPGVEEAAFPPRGEPPPGPHPPTEGVAPGGLSGTHSHAESAPPVPHRWGSGRRLESGVAAEPEPLGAAAVRLEAAGGQHHEPAEPGRPVGRPARAHGAARLLPPRHSQGAPGPRHQWPAAGNRLRSTDESGAEARAPLQLAVARAAEERLQQASRRAEEEQRAGPGPTSPPSRPAPSVPPLLRLSLQAAVTLLTEPRRQYRGSLAALAPVLAEQLLAHAAREGLLTPRTLRLFSGCALQRLRLDCCPQATNALLRQLRAFPALCRLRLVSCPVLTDQGLAVLQHLPRLQRLDLSACAQLTDRCLQFLTGLPLLSHLALDRTRVSDRGLVPFLLAAPPSLTHLSLGHTGVTEGSLRLLPQGAPRLLLLSLKQTGVTDVSALRQLEALQTLHLDGTRVSEASLRALSAHPALSCLTLAGVESVRGDHALELVSGLPLVQLTLPSRHTVTNVGLAALCRLTGLVELDLTDYSHISDEGLQGLPQLCRLRRLSLSNTPVTDRGLRHVQGLPLLEELCLDRLGVSGAGVARCIVCLPHLQVLSLAGTPVGDSVARRGLARCRQLLKLNLSRTRLTDRGLRFLVTVPLVQLNLDGSGVTAAGVASFLAACPSLGSVRAGNLRVLAAEDVSDEEGPG
ncbi:uncharacterized protein LOC123019557 [Varanus komodoensis]|uniref:uncharacterized protein LOC123019557 n=1 Tax=Varanus komodoensis TaxID=61221 RepID=UPI001CF7A005|nr:uncharacterized protein LOC123019557 [Varanus komodoensis]